MGICRCGRFVAQSLFMRPRIIALFLIPGFMLFASCKLDDAREAAQFKKALLESKKTERLKTELIASSQTLTGLKEELSAAIAEHTAAKAEMEQMKAWQDGKDSYKRSKELAKQSIVINNAEEAVFDLQEEIALQKQNISDLQADILLFP